MRKSHPVSFARLGFKDCFHKTFLILLVMGGICSCSPTRERRDGPEFPWYDAPCKGSNIQSRPTRHLNKNYIVIVPLNNNLNLLFQKAKTALQDFNQPNNIFSDELKRPNALSWLNVREFQRQIRCQMRQLRSNSTKLEQRTKLKCQNIKNNANSRNAKNSDKRPFKRVLKKLHKYMNVFAITLDELLKKNFTTPASAQTKAVEKLKTLSDLKPQMMGFLCDMCQARATLKTNNNERPNLEKFCSEPQFKLKKHQYPDTWGLTELDSYGSIYLKKLNKFLKFGRQQLKRNKKKFLNLKAKPRRNA